MRTSRGARAVRWLTLAVVIAAVGGCAYFNLFYNAERAFDEAERAAVGVDPRNLPTTQQRASYQRVIRKCRMLLDEYPDSDLVDDALFLMGKSHLRLKEYSDAIRNFDNVLVNFPNSEFVEESMYLKSLAHLGRGEEQIGLDWFARLREAFPEGRFGAEALYRLGDAYAEEDRPEQAIAYYRQFLERYPDRDERALVQLSLARVLVESGRPDEAVTTLDDFDARKVAPDAAFEANRLRILALVEDERPEEAQPLLDDLYASATDNEQRDSARLLSGRVLLSTGSYDEGVSVLQELARERSGQPVAAEALGLVVDYAAREYGPQSEELVAAIAATEGVRLGGDWGQRVRTRSQQIEEYTELQARVEAADSTSAAAAFDLAELSLLGFQRPADAAQWYERVLELDPTAPMAPRAAYALGWVREEYLDDPQGSQAAFARVERDYPESPQARSLRGEMFTEAKTRSREEIERLLASQGLGDGASGAGGVAGGRAGDPRLDPYRSLRFGGPGALTPR